MALSFSALNSAREWSCWRVLLVTDFAERFFKRSLQNNGVSCIVPMEVLRPFPFGETLLRRRRLTRPARGPHWLSTLVLIRNRWIYFLFGTFCPQLTPPVIAKMFPDETDARSKRPSVTPRHLTVLVHCLVTCRHHKPGNTPSAG